MNLYDPARGFAAPDRKALRCGPAVPNILTYPLEDGLVLLTAFLPHARNDFGTFYAIVSPEGLPQFFRLYRTDPEATLATYFGWLEPPKRPQVKTMERAKPQPLSALYEDHEDQSDLL